MKQVNNISYVSGGGERQQADLYLPEGEGPWPVAVVIHGGGWNSRDRSDMEKISKRLAANQIAAFNINYRLAPEHRHPAQLHDVHAAMRYLVAQSEVYGLDVDQMITVGYSAGAHLALLSAEVRDGDLPRIKAVIAGGAPTDLRRYPDSPYIKDLMGGPPSEFPERYREASPIVHVTPAHPPVFLYHGRLDLLVERKNALEMQAALQEAGVEVELDTRMLFGHLLTFLFDGPSMRRGIGFVKDQL
ncbi:alpha/beta hydrolase [Kiritimatiellaeota bacterium B1221]|nr:alpha/beta hydrolase [Kiritimatiellaeota bacterium B1221]